MIQLFCYKCGSELDEPGGLAFSPSKEDQGEKYHICAKCWPSFAQWIKSSAVATAAASTSAAASSSLLAYAERLERYSGNEQATVDACVAREEYGLAAYHSGKVDALAYARLTLGHLVKTAPAKPKKKT